MNESSSNGFFVNEPGDDQFDIVNSTGVCTDERYDYAHTQCQSRAGSAAIIGLTGCTARLGWIREYAQCPTLILTAMSYELTLNMQNVLCRYCGASVTLPGSDHLTAAIEESSLEYPRTLVPSSVVNGRVEEAITCYDPTDCVNKCLRLNRASRDGGLPAPQTCAMCQSICPSNVGTTIFMTIEALTQDVSTAIRVASYCLGDGGLSGCVCNIFQLLRPAWLDNLPSPQQKCSGGNVFGLIAKKIIELITSVTESAINGFLITPINKVLEVMLGWLTFGNPPQIPLVCFAAAYDPSRCKGNYLGRDSWIQKLGCEFNSETVDFRKCYFKRAEAICKQPHPLEPIFLSALTGPKL